MDTVRRFGARCHRMLISFVDIYRDSDTSCDMIDWCVLADSLCLEDEDRYIGVPISYVVLLRNVTLKTNTPSP